VADIVNRSPFCVAVENPSKSSRHAPAAKQFPYKLKQQAIDYAATLVEMGLEPSITQLETSALGRRIGKTEKTTEAHGLRSHQESVRFVWQGLRLVQEVDPDSVRSYVYSPDAAWTPLARVDVTNLDEVPDAFRTLAMTRPRVLHFHTDQIGTPQEVTGQDGELLWSGRHDAWGKLRKGDVTPRIEQPLRFAGQYADASTGLHYNTFRYYDPDVGRFISQDPIGLNGGENLYAYAPNSIRWVDPLGLNKADWRLFDSNGQLMDSGNNIKPDQGARNIPGRVGDTEQKILSGLYEKHGARLEGTRLEIESKPGFMRTQTGKTVPIKGMAPCNFCDNAMEQFAQKHGMSIEYKYSGKTRTYPGGCG
jgi:RHS repeat-associated protein